MDWISIIGFILGIYSAFLATILGINELSKSRKKVLVKLKEEHYLFLDGTKSTADFFFKLNIINKSTRPVRIDIIKLVWKNGNITLRPEAFNKSELKYPIILEDGGKEELPINLPTLISWFKFKKIFGIIRFHSEIFSTEEKKYVSNQIDFDIDFYLRICKDELVDINLLFPDDGFEIKTPKIKK